MLELTGGLGADVAVEAVGIPETFELCTEIVRPGGHVANVGVHGHPATLHLETLWIRRMATTTTGLVDTFTTPRLLKLIAEGRLDATLFATHRFALEDTMAAVTGHLRRGGRDQRAEGRARSHTREREASREGGCACR